MERFNFDELAVILSERYNLPSLKAISYAERLIDLQNRGITVNEAKPYLKSAGWDSVIADIYKDLIEGKIKKGINKMPEKKNTEEQMLPASLVNKMFSTMLQEFAEASGFRGKEDTESGAAYRDELIAYIRALATEVGSHNQDGSGSALQSIVVDNWIADVKAKVAELAALVADQQ